MQFDVLRLSSKSGEFDGTSGLLSDRLPIDHDVQAVVYLAQSPRYRDMPDHAAHLWSVNVLSAIRAAEWARGCGAARFVYASTGNVYKPAFHPHHEDDPLRRDSWYALSKVHAEEALRLYDAAPAVTCARLFGVYGPGQSGRLVPNLIHAVRCGDAIRIQAHPSDNADVDGFRLSLTYIEDVVSVLCHLALNAGPAVVNIASPEVWSIRHLATAIGTVVGRPPAFVTDEQPRESDLIADTDRLRAYWSGPFQSLSEGLAETVRERDATPLQSWR